MEIAEGFTPVSDCSAETRAEFVKKIYKIVCWALGAVAFLCWFLFKVGFSEWIYSIVDRHSWTWLVVLAGFTGLGWLSSYFAEAETTSEQYFGLGTYVAATSLVFSPLIYFIYETSGLDTIRSAVLVTAGLIFGLTAVVKFSKARFDFLRDFLQVGAYVSAAFIVSSILLGFNLGSLFVYGMICLAAGYVLYDTSRILNDYESDEYVIAALEFFSSITLLFWYILRLLNRRN